MSMKAVEIRLSQQRYFKPTNSSIASDSAESAESEQILFRKHPQYQKSQEWKLGVYKKQPGRNPVCAGCHKKTITEDSLQIVVDGLKNTKFCVLRTYHFCVDVNCITRKPPGSNLSPPVSVEVDGVVSSTDVELAIAAGIPIRH